MSKEEEINQEIFIDVLKQLDETMQTLTQTLQRIAQRMEEQDLSQ